MDSKKLAALLSSIVSQILLLLLHLLSPTTISTTSTSTSSSNLSSPSSSSSLFPLILHILSSSEISTSLALISSKKRKRTQDDKDGDEPDEPNHRSSDQNQEGELGLGFDSLRVPLQNLDSYKVFFRMNSSTFEWLSSLLEPLLDCRDPIDEPLNLSAEIRLGVGVFRLASGADYGEISRRFGVSESIARFCTKQLCRVLCTNFRFWVAFPTSDELDSVSSAYEVISGLPKCCGVVDCTRFKVIKEGNCNGGGLEEESIIAQIVVDSSMRILSIVAGFRGDKGDSRVLKSSTLFKDVEGGTLLNAPPLNLGGVSVSQYLIGDNGYPLLPWLMVPFVDPPKSSCEEDFNETIKRLRIPAVRTLMSLRKWGILNRPIKEEYKTSVGIIGACSILHNALLMRDDFSALADEKEDCSFYDQSSQYYPDNSSEENPITTKASVIRNALAARAKEVRVSKSSNMLMNL